MSICCVIGKTCLVQPILLLLLPSQVIDTVVNEHWWNIIQFIVAVLESNYPQPVKEQAVLVVAHIATGRTARCEVHRNGDLVEKLTLFMVISLL
ncbi:unnamed protein product [Trichobilharzia regenti]|nr:unnamed protein product [Trichobilharzia regenti]